MIRMRGIPVMTGLLLVLGATASLAQGHDQVIRDRQVMRTFRQPGRGQVWQDLNLSDEQKKKIEAITDRQRRDGIKARADLELAGLDLRKLMRADAPDRSAINSQIDKVTSMRGTLRKAQVAAMLDMRAVLTPDQLKKWNDARPMGRGGMSGMGGRRMLDGGDEDGLTGGLEGLPPPPESDDTSK